MSKRSQKITIFLFSFCTICALMLRKTLQMHVCVTLTAHMKFSYILTIPTIILSTLSCLPELHSLEEIFSIIWFSGFCYVFLDCEV